MKKHNDDNKYKILMENVYDLVFLYKFKPKPLFDYVSPSSIKINGYTPEEHYNDPDLFNKLVPADDLPLFEFIKENPQMIKKPVIIRWIRKDGKIIWTEQRFANIYDDNQIHIGIEGFVRDITERKETEFALIESEKKFRELFHQINDAIFLYKYNTYDRSLKLIELNTAACKMFSYSREEFLNIKTFDEIVDKKYINNIPKIVKIILQKKQFLFETILINKFGDKIPAEINAHTFRLSNNEVILTIIRNISEKKVLEAELLKKQRIESIGTLAARIAHDFNNILSAILGNLSLAKFKSADNIELSELLVDSEKATLKAKKLISMILTFSKGGAPIKEETSLKDLFKEELIFILKDTNIDYKLYFSDDLWMVKIDKEQIIQVISNLIKNSKDAMSDSGTIEIIAENITDKKKEKIPFENNQYIKISIKDTGIGISESDIDRIFDPFFTTKDYGSGMGLAAAYSIIKKHNGFITVNSKLKKGTTFNIYLPAIQREQDNKKNNKDKFQQSNIKGKILIMDDDDDVRFTTGKLLQKLGYEVEFARGGVEAIKLYKEAIKNGKTYKLLIMDLNIVGGMGGRDTIEALLKIDPEVKAIVSSGYFNDPIISNYKDYGFKGYISKPYTIEELDSTIKKII